MKIGADVPYCIMRGTALAEGIGEKLSKLPPMVKCPVLIAKPQISVSTKFVYDNLKLGSDMVHPDIDRLVADIREKDLYKIAADMGNVLETVTIPAYPVIADIKDHMMEHGAVNAMMSGSGPTVFGLFDKEATAVEAYEAMKASGARIIRLVEQYDDMVSLHRGRENLSPSDAMEYLMAGSGSLFDPKLIELFVEKIAVYPVGCEVELSNGMHGVVAKNFERFFLRPVVKVVETGEMLNLRDDPDTRSIIITKMVIH